ncbi:unnamed protein product [Danaus chrysippus]|nr:unnamed protein product [Danaus chrysippus]
MIKSTSKAKIKGSILEYITSYVQVRRGRSRPPSGNDMSAALRRDAGITPHPHENVASTSAPRESHATTRTTEISIPLNRAAASDSPENEDVFDDELEEDPTQTELSQRYPALPRTPCPKNLFIGNMLYSYLNNLYSTDRHLYPKRWNNLKKNDPDQAWHSLNRTMVTFFNSRWKNQGVQLEMGETPVDSMSYHDLKLSIVQTITEAHAAQGANSTPAPTSGSTPSLGTDSIMRLERSIGRLEEAARVLTSHTTKVTGREISSSTPQPLSQPQLTGFPSTSGPQKRPHESDSEEEVLVG